ncbi:uncharacterized protein snsl [Drosophila kikkawai]|uniref:Uncharacterized protein LOC108086199 n=1 Tax=Drosophila kikkawai TaxID=30033 RepID=A0A6P4JCD9_DROKI|nr:uncharacterized protein LOC108086199 [Drosophila kikkawai]
MMSWPKQWGFASLWLPLLLLGLLCTQDVSTFIVPRELPSILSIVYSNIPPIKKGTDSRLGFGFRLGEHADFQVMVELGPQKETRPIGEPSQDDQSFNKRQVSSSDQKALLRQLYRQQVKEEAKMLMTSTERNAASWLETWSNGMKPQKPQRPQKPKDQVKSRPVKESSLPQLQDPTSAMQQLQLLYKMATTSTSSTTGPPPEPSSPPPAPTFTGGSLNLGGPSGFKLPPPALSQDTNTLSNGNSEPVKSQSEITRELMDVSLDT